MEPLPFWSIDLGDVVSIVVLLAAITTAYINLRERIAKIEMQVGAMWGAFIEERRHGSRGEH